MTTKTRYFVIASLLVMGVGLGTGLVAYYVGLPMGAFQRRGGPEELQFIPRDATVIAFANVQEVMNSELRQKIRRVVPMQENGQREFENQTGINIETDIDRVVASLNPDPDSTNVPGAGMVLARGRFDEVKIEALMRDHGAQVEDYKTKRLIVADLPATAPPVSASGLSVAFLEPGLVAVGSTKLIRRAIDLHQSGDNPQTGLQSVTGNEELMNLVRSLDGGNVWAVGRFDALTSQAHLPQNVSGQLPAITWFSVSGRVNGGIRGMIRAEARDDEAANNLRDVVRGFMALAKMQTGSRPELQAMMQSFELGGTGKTVALSFAVPAEVFDMVPGASRKMPAPKPPVH
ncbi:MAG: hypothetical protein HY047_09755 [Acidobacteria bacterium]|nr:hypothetical protein [Acidobacteriota bacterium]